MDVPLDVLGVSAEVGCMINFVLKELDNAVSRIGLHTKYEVFGGRHTIPVTLLPMKFAG